MRRRDLGVVDERSEHRHAWRQAKRKPSVGGDIWLYESEGYEKVLMILVIGCTASGLYE